MMALSNWIKGRNNTGYWKKLLFTAKNFDVYLLKYPEGSCIPPHIDQCDEYNHFRFNLVLKKAKLGGDFVCKKTIVSLPRIYFFRPDLEVHEVTRVTSGTRYVLSVGWVTKK